MAAFEVPIKLLLVDDEAEFLESTERALRRRGFQVTTARDGNTALRVLQIETFDVAVLDIKMPGIQGDDLFRIVSQRWPNLPVILLTGHGSIGQAFTTSKQGVFDYLTKPCPVEKLAGLARQAAGLAASGDSARELPGDPPQQADPAKTALDGDELEEIRLLLVDDEPEFLHGTSAGLRRRGIATAVATSGKLAMDLVARQQFDVAVIDLRMPGMDGLELLGRLKARQPAMQVVLLTGQPSVGTVRRALNQGAFDYLLKPHAIEDLVAKIRAGADMSRRVRAQQQAAKIEDILNHRPD